MRTVVLEAKNARDARTEISARWPNYNVSVTGRDKTGETVYMSMVRRQGDAAHVATARKNTGLPAVKFEVLVP